MTTKTDTEQERAEFEAAYAAEFQFAAGRPGKFDLDANDDYEDVQVLVGWRMWQAGRAALQSQVNSEASNRVREFLDNWLKIRLNDKTVVYQLNGYELRVDDLRTLIALQSQDREDVLEKARYALMIAQAHAPCPLYAETIEAIDRARRIEGGGE